MSEPGLSEAGDGAPSAWGTQPPLGKGSRWALVGLLAVLLLIVAAFIAFQSSIFQPDHGSVNELVASTREVQVTLDAAHPVVEQRITMKLNAAALPTDLLTRATLDVAFPLDHGVRTGGSSSPGVSADPTVETEPPASTPSPDLPIEVTLVREDSNAVVPVTYVTSNPQGLFRRELLETDIDCVQGRTCDRVFRVRIAAPELTAATQVVFSYVAEVKIRYSGLGDGAHGQPEGGKASITGEPPVAIAASRTAFAAPIPSGNGAGPIVTRHLTVTASSAHGAPDGSPISASARLYLTQASAEQSRTWRVWVRVVPDGGRAPVADAYVGERLLPEGNSGTLDFPVLEGCAVGPPCTRGYWLVFQSASDDPVLIGQDGAAGPATLGQLAWSVDATAVSSTDTGRWTIGAAIDDLPSPPGQETGFQIRHGHLEGLSEAHSRAEQELSITAVRQSRAGESLDGLLASFAIVYIRAAGDDIAPAIEIDGIGRVGGDLNGVVTITHPLDRCPREGVCHAGIRMIQEGTQGASDWSVSLVGVPPATDVTVTTRQ